MAATALEIIALSEFKMHQRLLASDSSQDAMLTDYINAAVAAVEDYTGRTLVDKTRTETFAPKYSNVPHALFSDGIRIGSDNMDDTMNAEITYADDGGATSSAMCVIARSGPRGAIIHPPESNSGCWPEVALNDYGNPTPFSVSLTLVGLEDAQGNDATPAPLKNAAILIARALFSQGGEPRAIPAHTPAEVLMGPYRRSRF